MAAVTAVPRYDVVGIGVGPANLSLAALAEPVADLRAIFLERSGAFRWHPGVLFRDAELQVSFVKDLVTLVDPTNPYSFLNFLARTGRLSRFLVLSEERVTRREFSQYYSWAAEQLSSVHFDSPVDDVSYDRDAGFTVRSRGRAHQTAALVVGTGRQPVVPAAAAAALGPTVLHSSEVLLRDLDPAGRRVLVVGGGQSGAEVVARLLDVGRDAPASLTWASRRAGFLPLDDTAFTNELFNPRYVEYFHTLSRAARGRLLEQQRLASDGVSAGLLARIHRRLYEIDFLDDVALEHRLLPGRELTELHGGAGAGPHRAVLRRSDDGLVEEVEADLVVLATGYREALPACLDGLVDPDAVGSLDADYRLDWAHADRHDIFMQNGARLSHGIADPNLSLVSWRAATILNALCLREVHPTGRDSSTVDWAPAPMPVAVGAAEVLR